MISVLFLTVSALASPGFEPLDAPNPLPPSGGVYIPDLTWMEVRDAVADGKTTLFVPIGGIEQNGPFLALSKHDLIAREVAQRVAVAHGDALVAPVVSFVPEGDIFPKSGHMHYAGTVSVRDSTLDAILTDVARSYRAHGFETIAFLGDSGGNQDVQRRVARRLDRRWSKTRVVSVDAFYDPGRDKRFLIDRGLVWTEDGHHDDPAFTLQVAVIDPAAARLEARRSVDRLVSDGVELTPDNLQHGQALLDHRVERTLAGLDEALAAEHPIEWRRGLALVTKPFGYLVDPSQRIFGMYLLVALFMAFLVQLRTHGADLKAIGAALFPRKVWLSGDARADLLWTLFGGLVLYGFFATAFAGLTETIRLGLLGWFEEVSSPALPASVLWITVATIVVALATDFAVFLAHWAQHRIPFLWTFHRVHHSARELTFLTVYRMHPVDLLLNSLLLALWVGSTTAVLTWLFAGAAPAWTMYGINIVTFLFYLLGYNLRHSHVWLDYGPLDHVLISPAMHQIHHSVERRHWDRNMGLVFSFWDRLFGTLYVPSEREDLTFGIGEDGDTLRTPIDFVVEPFRKVLDKGDA